MSIVQTRGQLMADYASGITMRSPPPTSRSGWR
jgi:hypothetical protein